MRRILSIAVLLSVIPITLLVYSHSIVNRPRIHLPKYPLTLGLNSDDRILTGTFEIENRGGACLDFNLSASCGCSEIFPKAGRIQPWTSAKIKVVMKTSDEWIDKQILISIDSNDPIGQHTVYTIRAFQQGRYLITPSELIFRSTQGDDIDPLKISIRRSDYLKGGFCKNFQISPSDDLVSIEKISINNREMSALVNCRRGLSEGTYKTGINVIDPDLGFKDAIPATIIVDGEITASPRTLVFSKNQDKLHFLVKIHKDNEYLISPKILSIDSGFRVEEESRTNLNVRVRKFLVRRVVNEYDWSNGSIILGFDKNRRIEIKLLNLH